MDFGVGGIVFIGGALVLGDFILGRLVTVFLWQTSRDVDYVGSTEIPMVGNILVPYELQVEGCVDNLSPQAWALGLIRGRNVN